MKCGTYLLADDRKIFQQIATKEDALQLQSDKFIGAMVSEMTNDLSATKLSCLGFGKVL